MDITSGGYILAIVAIARAVEAVSRLFWNRHNKRKYSQADNDRRKNTVRINKNDKPGKAQVCIKHTEKVGKLETKVKMLCDSNTREHGELRSYVKEKFDDVIDRLSR